MASYSIGDESDDDFDFQQQQRGGTSRSQGGAGLAPVSSRQPHQYIDPFDDDFASPSTSTNNAYAANGAFNDGHNASGSGGAAAPRQPRAYDDALLFDDFTGGKPANPLGTASDVRDSAHASDFNRYDVYEE